MTAVVTESQNALRLPIGYTFAADPDPVTLDLPVHLNLGAHALVVGRAGTGKTELLSTAASAARAAGARVLALQERGEPGVGLHAHYAASGADEAVALLDRMEDLDTGEDEDAVRTVIFVDGTTPLLDERIRARIERQVRLGRSNDVSVVLAVQGLQSLPSLEEFLRWFAANTSTIIGLQPNKFSAREIDLLSTYGLDARRTGPTQPGVGVVADASPTSPPGGVAFRTHLLRA